MKNVKAPTNIEKWFPNKRYVLMVVSKKDCPLKYHRRLVYSYLVYRLRQDQTATQAKVVKALRLDKTAVASAIGELETLGLVVRERGQYQAAKPNENQRQWFASNGRTDGPWHRRFATYPVLRPQKSSGLSTKTNALLWLLYSLAPKHGKPVVLGQCLAGLAVMLNMSEKGVKQGVGRLEKMGLIERLGSTFLLKQPSAEALALWEDRPVRQETAFKLTSHVKVQINNLETTDPEYQGKMDDLATINEMFDRHGVLMQRAGCSPGEIIEYWRYVIKHSGSLDDMWTYAVNFECAFRTYAEQHRAKGYSGSPMKLLWLKVKERLPEYDPSTF
jgi:DNA-binding MarR family transcriptional regulator